MITTLIKSVKNRINQLLLTSIAILGLFTISTSVVAKDNSSETAWVLVKLKTLPIVNPQAGFDWQLVAKHPDGNTTNIDIKAQQVLPNRVIIEKTWPNTDNQPPFINQDLVLKACTKYDPSLCFYKQFSIPSDSFKQGKFYHVIDLGVLSTQVYFNADKQQHIHEAAVFEQYLKNASDYRDHTTFDLQSISTTSGFFAFLRNNFIFKGIKQLGGLACRGIETINDHCRSLGLIDGEDPTLPIFHDILNKLDQIEQQIATLSGDVAHIQSLILELKKMLEDRASNTAHQFIHEGYFQYESRLAVEGGDIYSPRVVQTLHDFYANNTGKLGINLVSLYDLSGNPGSISKPSSQTIMPYFKAVADNYYSGGDHQDSLAFKFRHANAAHQNPNYNVVTPDLAITQMSALSRIFESLNYWFIMESAAIYTYKTLPETADEVTRKNAHFAALSALNLEGYSNDRSCLEVDDNGEACIEKLNDNFTKRFNALTSAYLDFSGLPGAFVLRNATSNQPVSIVLKLSTRPLTQTEIDEVVKLSSSSETAVIESFLPYILNDKDEHENFDLKYKMAIETAKSLKKAEGTRSPGWSAIVENNNRAKNLSNAFTLENNLSLPTETLKNATGGIMVNTETAKKPIMLSAPLNQEQLREMTFPDIKEK